MQEAQTTLPIGSIVRDRYVVKGLLGQGGAGAVYLVSDQRVRGNLFALKEVVDPNKKERHRIIFEAEVLMRLEHSILPRVYWIFDDEPHYRTYILMDYIEGTNLENLRQQQPGRRFILSRVLTLMAPIMGVVTYLHQQKPPIIHRDIKPSNIIVPANGGKTVLVDFGIAKEFDDESTTTAVRRCSPGYGAPEQYGQGTNVRTDIYGLAATCYVLLTGVVPADALTRMTTMGGNEDDPLIPIRELVPIIPQHVADAIQQGLAINSAHRFASVEQFWQALSADPAWQPPREAVLIPEVFTRPSTIQRQGEAFLAHVAPQRQVVKTERSRIKPLFLIMLLLFIGSLVLGGGTLLYFVQASRTSSASSDPGVTVAPRIVISPGFSPTAQTTKQAAVTSPTATAQPTAGVTPTATATAVPIVQPTPTPSPVATAQPTPTPKPTPTPSPTPVAYPRLVSAYSGTVENTRDTPHLSANMTLTAIKQNNAAISGYFTVYSPLVGSNPFTGSVGTNNTIQFTVASYNGNGPLYFTGTVQSNGNLAGTYCSLDQGGHCSASAGASGIWSVAPAKTGSIAASAFIVHHNVRIDTNSVVLYCSETLCLCADAKSWQDRSYIFPF